MEEVKLVFKGRSYTFTIAEVMYFEVRDNNLDFALISHKPVMDLDKYQYMRPGSYRIPTSDLIWAGLR